MIFYLILFPIEHLLPTPKRFKSQQWTELPRQPSFVIPLPLSESMCQEKVSLHNIQPPFWNVTATRADTCPSKHH